jgi:hypothetical protein
VLTQQAWLTRRWCKLSRSDTTPSPLLGPPGTWQLVHALEEFDGDLLLAALTEQGFVMQHDAVEPSEVFRDLAFAFRASSGDAAASRAEAQARIADDMKRQDTYMIEHRQHTKAGKAAPIANIPGVVVFFLRSMDMLQGLCTRRARECRPNTPNTRPDQIAALQHSTAPE